jgi:transposase
VTSQGFARKVVRHVEHILISLLMEANGIIIHFTPYHGSWLNLVEFWFGIVNKKVLNESYGSAEKLKEGFDLEF